MLEELLSQALRGAMGGGQAQQPAGAGALINILGSLLNNGSQSGGLAGLIARFAQAGLGQHMQSWIGTGQNMPVSSDQLSQVFGQQGMQQMAQQAGMDHAEFGGMMAQVLPQLIDRLTPNGQVPHGGVEDAIGMLGKLMRT
jgi:uncharacterized protein YidB (DUF937 family)